MQAAPPFTALSNRIELPGLDDPAYARTCREQITEAAHCVHDGTWSQSRFMESFTDAFVKRAATSRVFVDVGAERGFYTHLALRYMPEQGRVVAIEPEPYRAAALRRYFADASRVTVVEAAAGASTRPVTLFKNGVHSASVRADGGESFVAQSVVLDELAEAQDADLIKIDAEGAEVEVLGGMREILHRVRCHIYVEFHPWADEITPDARKRIRELADQYDYRITRTDLAESDSSRLVGGRMILAPSA